MGDFYEDELEFDLDEDEGKEEEELDEPDYDDVD